MSEEFTLVAPRVAMPVETVVAPLDEVPGAGVTLETPRSEDTQASEAYFIRQNQETHAVAGLVGLWASAQMLHDLAVEHFEDREEPRPIIRRIPGKRPE